MAKVALYTGDCLAALRSFRAASVDLVMCSPPYEDARTYGIDFNLSGDAWVNWAAERFMECLRVSRGLVAWVVAGRTQRFMWSATPAKLMVALERRGAVLRNPCIFHRVGIPGSGSVDWFRSDYEWIVCATSRRGPLPWAKPTACGHPPKWGPGGEMSHRLTDGTRRNQWGHSGSGEKAERKRDGTRGTAIRPSHVMWRMAAGKSATGEQKPNRSAPAPKIANPGNVIHCKVGGGVMGDRLAHKNEAPYPEKLAERFVLSCCPPGGTVLDPFSGSGTTVKVAVAHGRNGIGIDVRDDQNDIAEKRLKLWEAGQLGKRVKIRRIKGAR